MSEEKVEPEFSIRKAREEDIEDIWNIEKEVFLKPLSHEGLTHELRIDFSSIIVAEQKNEIIAYAIVWVVHDEIQLNKIAVKSDYRRIGVGKTMVNYIIKNINPGEAKSILIEVREKDGIARAFYENLGFIETGIREKYYVDDNAILMKKDVS